MTPADLLVSAARLQGAIDTFLGAHEPSKPFKAHPSLKVRRVPVQRLPAAEEPTAPAMVAHGV